MRKITTLFLLFLFGIVFPLQATNTFPFANEFTAIWNTSKISTGSSASNEITIPTNSAFTYNYTVDWGDGSSDTNVTGDITHTYVSEGFYTVLISGTFPAIYFNDSGDVEKIIEILDWGIIQWQSMENAFHGCINLNFDAISSPDLSQVTSLKNMFKDTDSFNGILNNWDITTITDLSGMFSGAKIFNRPLDNWNTSNVTNMSDTFRGTGLFNEPLDNWNTSLVTNLSGMFYSASDFNQNINNWDVSQVVDMSYLFYNASSFNTPLNLWNVSNVTNMSNTFGNTNFNYPLNNWDMSKVTNMSGMFRSSDFNQSIGNWNVSSVTNLSFLFQRANAFNQPLNNWDVSNVTTMESTFDGYYWSNKFNLPLDNWDVSKVTNMRNMFRDTRDFNQNINNWNVSSVTNMSGMFEQTDKFNQDISGWNISSVTNIASMFKSAKVFNQPLENLDISSVTNLSYVFYRAEAFNQPLNNWDTSLVTNMSHMFSSISAVAVFNQPLNNWNTGSVRNMSNMFAEATVFNQDLSAWNISEITNMTNMLNNSGLTKENYDNALISWAGQTVKSNVNLGATNLNYCDGRFARQDLIDNFNWIIVNDIIDCPFVLCTSLISPVNGDPEVPANANLIWQQVPGATGYRVTVRIENGSSSAVVENNTDVGNVAGLDFASDLTPGDEVFVTVVPYNANGPAVGCTEESFTVVASWVNDPTTFKLTYDTEKTGFAVTPPNQLEIKRNGSYTYNYDIDWGDDQYNNNVTGNITHTYLTPGVYTVTIKGDYPAPYNDYFTDHAKLISIDQWGTQQWKSMNSAFFWCENMTYNATDIPDLSQVTRMDKMFQGARVFNGNIDNWDVSTITNMESMFYRASSFNQPLNSWSVDNITNMESMFYGASEFNQPLNNWNTTSLTNSSRMFDAATVFNQPLNSFSMNNVTNTARMFRNAKAFNQPLDNWVVDKVTDMRYMFYGSSSGSGMTFNQNLNNWNVTNVTDMSFMFYGCGVFNNPLNNWTLDSLTTTASMFYLASSFNQPLNNWDVSAVTNMDSMFYAALAFNQNIEIWDVTNVVTMKSMFQNAEVFNQPLNNWDVNSVVNMERMFSNAAAFNQPLNNWDVSAVATMAFMFNDAVVFDQSIGNWDVSSVTLMPSMFSGASAFNQNINTWNVTSVTRMDAMFKDAILFNQALNNWNTRELQTTKEMFSGASAFNQNINSWKVSFISDMEAMFKNAIVYNQPMDTWNVASVTTMKDMFNGATVFNQNIDSWNVRAVSTAEAMFYNATAFNQPLNNWRVANIGNMNSMFRNAMAFNQPLDQWNLGNLTMRYFLSGATAFNQELSAWSVGGVTNMANMLDNTAINRENYDKTLIGWSQQTLTNGVSLGAQGLLYCDALEERQTMITNYSWTINGDILDCPIPTCTQLLAPLNGEVDVPVNTNLSWDPVLYARGYRLTVVTQPGAIVLVDNETITNETSYTFASDFTSGVTVEVTLTPFNDTGDAGVCTTESFTITASSIPTVPDCTNLSFPLDGDTDIAVTSSLTWQAISNADGYRITVGTSPGANDIVDNADLGNVIAYDFMTDLPEDTTIYTTITPYNSTGDAIACTEESFTTELIPVAPDCTNLTLAGAVDVPIDTNLSWDAIPNATGYLLSVGTTGGGIEILNNIDVGNVTTYDLPDDLNTNRLIFVRITPYNSVGDATGCTEETFKTGNGTSTIPMCTALTAPVNSDPSVAITTDLTWNAIGSATGYKLSVGTTSGGTDILALTDVGNVTTYNLPADLPESTTIFVTVIPYNGVGDAIGCTADSFTTETLPVIPGCTSLISSLNNESNVSITTAISWDAASTATGYKLSVGTTSGGTDILALTDVGNVSTYNLPADLPESTTIFVTVIPYNGVGDAVGCTADSFTTETLPVIPDCTSLIGALNNESNVSITTAISWDAASTATGYKLSVGTTSGGTDILVLTDVANVTTYDLPAALPENTTIFVTVIPYNGVGDAVGCTADSFTTETLPVIPGCTSLISSLKNESNVSVTTAISWDVASIATGYKLSVGTTSGGTDILVLTDVANVTTYDLPAALPENTTIFVTVIPYNGVGDAIGCTADSFTTETLPVIPDCTSLISSLKNESNVSVTTAISWDAVSTATGYKLSVGTTSGGTDILALTDVGNVTTYDLPADLPENTTVFVTVIPYNGVGDAIGCIADSFTTETLPVVPGCTSLISSLKNESNVSITTAISWDAASTATGYKLSVGTTSGGTDILALTDVGNVTTYNLPTALPESTTIFVTVIPYNGVGDAVGCTADSFTTETLPVIPGCTSLISSLKNESNVSVTTAISWDAASTATGYKLNVGTTSGGTDILTLTDVGNVTTYDLPAALPENTTIFVTVIPYNGVGDAVGCTADSFTTETLPVIPGCTSLISSLKNESNVSVTTAISWDAASTATGYKLSVGTTSGGTDILVLTDVGNVTTYNLPAALPENTTIFVTVIPYNGVGDAVGCTADSFTTETLPVIADCTEIIAPIDGEADVAVDASFSWEAVDNATGYILTIGTTSGGTDVLNNEDVGSLTQYSLANDLENGTIYFISAVAYNQFGNATGCSQSTFTTIVLPKNEVKHGFSPNDDGINDYWHITGIENHPTNTVTIYNRWGDMVFEIQNYDNTSNVFRGIANRKTKMGANTLPSGTYFYTLGLTEAHNFKSLQGFVVIKR